MRIKKIIKQKEKKVSLVIQREGTNHPKKEPGERGPKKKKRQRYVLVKKKTDLPLARPDFVGTRAI